jgi:hypothetical protein
LRKLMNLHNWKSSSAQCSMADKQFIESLTLNWSFDCLSDFVFSWLLGSFLFILINNLFENKDKSMRDVLHVNFYEFNQKTKILFDSIFYVNWWILSRFY